MESTDKSHKKLIAGNKDFVKAKKEADPAYFKKLSLKQEPDYLWIGCSDSRVPAGVVTSTIPGEIFLHCNIANIMAHTDLNSMSVLEYAVKVLKVKHIIVCGHYGCGGIDAAMSNKSFGIIDKWIRVLKDVYLQNEKELLSIKNMKKRAERLAELNVIEQVRNIAKTKVVQEAWRMQQKLEVHGWIYNITTGLIKELDVLYDEPDDLENIFRYML